MRSLLADRISEVNERGEKALGIFITSGFPNLEATVPLLQTIDEAGADFIELGMPFSDPLAEGVPIQKSSQIALESGVTMQDTLRFAAEFRKTSETPLVLMGYGNPILQYGINNFYSDARSCGVNGVILPDVLPDMASPFYRAAQANKIDVICLISPTTSAERMKKIDRLSSGFVYAVSVTGVTGADLGDSKPILDYLRQAKQNVSRNPILVGFGIKSGADVRKMTPDIEGAIVGSALVTMIGDLWADSSLQSSERLDRVKSFVRELKSDS